MLELVVVSSRQGPCFRVITSIHEFWWQNTDYNITDIQQKRQGQDDSAFLAKRIVL